MILSGHPSILLELCLSDTSEGVLIWSNLTLDFKTKLLQINTGVVC